MLIDLPIFGMFCTISHLTNAYSEKFLLVVTYTEADI